MPSRTHNCGELNKTHINSSVTLCGWVNSLRTHGKIIFIDIRDRYGKTQIILDKKDLINKGNSLSNEDVITISGKVFGNVQASDAHIGGSLKGDISVANKIVLGRKSEIIGDLLYSSLIIEDGAQFQGSCSVIGNKENTIDSSLKEPKPRFTMASPADPNA